jgi:2-polyprenyl-6-methoxyphenol hydroxylase-like FAD-dependent oxidoreductase
VAWGHKLVSSERRGGSVTTLTFANGSTASADLVVGADGAWSRVRPLVSRYQPQYSGLTFIEFGIDEVDTRHPALSRLVGRGKMGVEGSGRSLIVQRNGNAHLRGYAIFRVPVEWAGAPVRRHLAGGGARRAGR